MLQMCLKYPVKIWARLNNFKGCFGLICHFTIPSPPALPIHVFWLNMYFLSNTLLNSLLQVPTLAHQVVYWLTCALLGKFWEHLNPTPATPTTDLLELIYHTNNHYYTGCNSETYAFRFSIRQLIFWPNFRIIDQYLVLVWLICIYFWPFYNNIRIQ